MSRTPNFDVTDLAGLVYSSGKVFNGLNTNRLDTEEFLRTGDVTKVNSRADLELLKDLRDAAQFVIDRPNPVIDADFVLLVNACLTRSGSLQPGVLRSNEQRVGADTVFGRHEPPAVIEAELTALIQHALEPNDRREQAMNLFIELARAQPFGDGNKRTALFVANSVTIWGTPPETLIAPVDENDPEVAARFNRAIANAYINDDRSDVKAILRADGFQLVTEGTQRNRRVYHVQTDVPRPKDVHANGASHPFPSPDGLSI
ncbi:Fic family protein [Gulosibacter bifidus]|uniref:Fic family protein n=1 Tax=Gulosibacter bifidus TaxID=272239 RepID=A0ABW5RHJ1_9MICO|nr:Fic family protein [Gulosibacter bifidus]